MRVQVQKDLDPSVYDSRRLRPTDETVGVTVEQARAALQELLSSPAIPSSVAGGARDALARAVAWIAARPPGGVVGRVSQSFYFDRKDTDGFRFDVENLYGHNLKS